jgi:hypothetical protein
MAQRSTSGAPAPPQHRVGTCNQTPLPAGTLVSAGSKHPMCNPFRQYIHTAASAAGRQRSCTCLAGVTGIVGVGSLVRSMLGLWQGAQFSRCSLNSVPSAPCNINHPLAPTRCTLYAPRDTNTSVLLAGCRRGDTKSPTEKYFSRGWYGSPPSARASTAAGHASRCCAASGLPSAKCISFFSTSARCSHAFTHCSGESKSIGSLNRELARRLPCTRSTCDQDAVLTYILAS